MPAPSSPHSQAQRTTQGACLVGVHGLCSGRRFATHERNFRPANTHFFRRLPGVSCALGAELASPGQVPWTHLPDFLVFGHVIEVREQRWWLSNWGCVPQRCLDITVRCTSSRIAGPGRFRCVCWPSCLREALLIPLNFVHRCVAAAFPVLSQLADTLEHCKVKL